MFDKLFGGEFEIATTLRLERASGIRGGAVSAPRLEKMGVDDTEEATEAAADDDAAAVAPAAVAAAALSLIHI